MTNKTLANICAKHGFPEAVVDAMKNIPTVEVNDLTGGIKIQGPGGKAIPLNSVSGENTFHLMIGSDHANATNWGVDASNAIVPQGNGFMQMLLDGGLEPYLSVTTGNQAGAPAHVPGNSAAMSWNQVAALQAKGVEILSHSHQHIQRWDRLNTGIVVQYKNAGATATMAVTATDIVLTSATGGAENATIPRSGLTTINDVLAAINAVGAGAWLAYIRGDASLTGVEKQSNLLPIAGSRDVKTVGWNQYFCCGGGMQIYMGNSGSYAQIPLQVKCRIKTNGWMEITVDGVVKWYGDLAAVATDTFAELVAVLNTALNATGIYFALSDNGQSDSGGSGFVNYMRGDELCTSLKTFLNRNISPGNLAAYPVVAEVGLTQAYIREQQFKKSIATAEANGVTFDGFAEPGNQSYPWQMGGFGEFKTYRGTAYSRVVSGVIAEPVTYPLTQMRSPFFVRSACGVVHGYTTPAHMVALAEAMADSPGHACCLLWHGLATSNGTVDGYNLGTVASEDQQAVNAKAFIDAVQPYLESGAISPTTLLNASNSIGASREPFNWLFNAGLKHSAASVPINTVNDKALIPGWLTNLGNVAGAAAVFNADGTITISSSSAVDFTLKQTVMLDRNSDWIFGAEIFDSAVTGGTGASIAIQRTQARVLGGSNSEVNQSLLLPIAHAGYEPGSSNAVTGASNLSGRMGFARDESGYDPAKMIGLAGPFTIGAGTTDGLSIQINGINPGAALTLTAGSRTASQIVDEILAWLKTDSVFSTYPEFWNLAKARRAGRTAPAVILGELDNVFKLVVTGTSLLTIFGGVSTGAGHVAEGFFLQDINTANYAVQFSLQVNVIGSITIGRPYLKRMEMV